MRTLKLIIENSIAKIILDRPGLMNSIDEVVSEEFVSCLNDIKDIEEVRVVIIRGEGNAFSTGADLYRISKILPITNIETVREISPYLEKLYNTIDYFEKITIASINGFCLAGGFLLAAMCDLRIASDKAVFGMPEVQFGMFPTYLSIPRIVRLVGMSIAQEIILTGEPFSAERAMEIGFVHKVVPHEKLDEETLKLANRILDNAPVTMKKAKKGFIMLKKGELENYYNFDKESLEQCMLTEDFTEGVRAVLEKRKPQFKGR